MMRLLIKILLFSLPFLLIGIDTMAQCAMCRATVENNVSNGVDTIGAGLNFGILYLFSIPYLVIGTVGYLWYRNSKLNAKNEQLKRHYSR